ncbi:MAG: hypothetical protein R2883_03915 [Caldisericia bacterium]
MSENLKIYRLLASEGGCKDDSIPEYKELGGSIPMIYSTPALAHDKIVFGTSCSQSQCSNGGKLYCYNSTSLEEEWV